MEVACCQSASTNRRTVCTNEEHTSAALNCTPLALRTSRSSLANASSSVSDATSLSLGRRGGGWEGRGRGGTEKDQILVGEENKRNLQNKKNEKRITNLNYADRAERLNDDAGQVTDL